MSSERDGWLRLPDVGLLKQCRQESFRSSGPGGQHRNKVETAMRLHHLPSGVTAQAGDLRLREENRKRAIRRLRERIAFEVRTPFDLEMPMLSPEFLAQRGAGTTLSVNPKNSSFPLIAALALDALAAAGGSYAKAAHALGVTTSQLLGFLKSDRELWRAASDAKGSQNNNT
ncbi:MAG: peptide chain release factor-like protein [Dehalococcoidia bacterium]